MTTIDPFTAAAWLHWATGQGIERPNRDANLERLAFVGGWEAARSHLSAQEETTLANLRRVIDGPHPADSGLDSYTLAYVSKALDEAHLTAQEPDDDVPPGTHTRNMPCSLIPAGDDPDTVLLRRAAASERADERHWPADLLTQAADTIDRLRRQHQGQADHITVLRTEVDRLSAAQEPTDAEELARFNVENRHQFHDDLCICGFGANRSRSKTEHIMTHYFDELHAARRARGGTT